MVVIDLIDMLSDLGGTNKHLHSFLERKDFSYNTIYGLMDDVDLYNAKIISSALEMRKCVYVSFPDFFPHRPAILFASALVKHFLDSYGQTRNTTSWGNPIIYFGSNIGIREQLSQVSIKYLGFDFSQVFAQIDLLRNTKEKAEQLEKLPKVITSYAPSDPTKLLHDVNPPWIAIDCDSANTLNWLEPLLNTANSLDIPVISWAQNPLSYCNDLFKEKGQVFAWPTFARDREDSINKGFTLQEKYVVTPTIPAAAYIDDLTNLFVEIRNDLVHISKRVITQNRVINDAISIHWQCYSMLDSLVVPVRFHDAEARKIWGLKSTEQLIASCIYFQESISAFSPPLSSALESIESKLLKCRDLMIDCGVPFWDACIKMIFDNGSEKEYTLIFPNDGKKRLFQYALLAKYNLSEAELIKKGVYITSLNSMRVQYRQRAAELSQFKTIGPYQAFTPNKHSNPVIIGIPSQHIAPNLFYVLHNKEFGFLICPHQISSLQRFLSKISRQIYQFTDNHQILSALSGKEDIDKSEQISAFHINDPYTINMAGSPSFTQQQYTLLDHLDPTTEIELLFKQEDFDDDDLSIIPGIDDDNENNIKQDKSAQLWCDEVFLLKFNNNWTMRLPQDAFVNVIKNGNIETQYIPSIKPSDTLLVISGQVKQSLYHLVLSRVHQHPAIELHLALIKRWQQELTEAYDMWLFDKEAQYSPPHSLEGLLHEMQGLGSKIVTTLTLDNWIKGYVIAPLDQEDIQRLAKVLDIDFIKKNHRSIGRAAARLRSLHRSLSRRLNQWIQNSMSGDYSKDDSQIIDEELGLTFGDIRNSLQVLTVREIQKIPGPFLRDNLGRLNKEVLCE